jgi:hypothetical protein
LQAHLLGIVVIVTVACAVDYCFATTALLRLKSEIEIEFTSVRFDVN